MRLVAAEGRGAVVLLRDTSMKMTLAGDVSPPDLAPVRSRRADPVVARAVEDRAPDQLAPAQDVGLEAYGLEIVGTRKIPDLG